MNKFLYVTHVNSALQIYLFISIFYGRYLHPKTALVHLKLQVIWVTNNNYHILKYLGVVDSMVMY